MSGELFVIPADIHAAAEKITTWAKMQGHHHWVFGGICSRDFVDDEQSRQAQPTPTVAKIAAGNDRLRAELEQEQENHAQLQARCYEGFPSASDGIFDALKEAQAELEQAKAFKDFVHRRLDSADVPKEFPDGEHTKEGCRIGDRLDWLFDQTKGGA